MSSQTIYSYNEYDLVFLNNENDIINEGKELDHCLKNDKNHIYESIYSIRKNGKSLYTFEVSKEGVLIQLSGLKNSGLKIRDVKIFKHFLNNYLIKQKIVKIINKNSFLKSGWIEISRMNLNLLKKSFVGIKNFNINNQDYVFKNNKLKLQKEILFCLRNKSFKECLLDVLSGDNKLDVLNHFYANNILDEEDYTKILKRRHKLILSDEYLKWMLHKNIEFYCDKIKMKLFLMIKLENQYGSMQNIYEFNSKIALSGFIIDIFVYKDRIIKENLELFLNLVSFKRENIKEISLNSTIYFLILMNNKMLNDIFMRNYRISQIQKQECLMTVNLADLIIEYDQRNELETLNQIVPSLNIIFAKNFPEEKKRRVLDILKSSN